MKKIEIGRWNIEWFESFQAARDRINQNGINISSVHFEKEENQVIIWAECDQKEVHMIELGMYAAKHYWHDKRIS